MSLVDRVARARERRRSKKTDGHRVIDGLFTQRAPVKLNLTMGPPSRDGQADLGELWSSPDDGELWIYTSTGWKIVTGEHVQDLLETASEPSDEEKQYLRQSLGLGPEVEL